MAENTFLGLQPYTEADAYRFKGRMAESQELFRLIVRNDYTVCYAESGEGKTSLLNAGVFPLLRQNMFFPIEITFTSDDYQSIPDSFDTIIDRCIKDSIVEYNKNNEGINIEYKLCSIDFRGLECQAELQRELSKYSWWKLRNFKPQAMGLTFIPVFIFDQFEEVFNLPGSIVWTKKFFDWLEDVSSDNCPDEIVNKVREIIGTNAAFPAIKGEKDFKAVFSLRKEYIGELDYWGMQQSFIPGLKDNRYCLKALTFEGAKKVMTQQERFDEDKVVQVLRYFIHKYSHEPEKANAKNLPVIPALLLSVVCDSWEKDINYFSDIDANGIGQSLNKILEKFYDEAIGSVVNELSQQEGYAKTESIRSDIEAAIFALVDGNGKRVRRKSSELSHLDFDTQYKEILSDKRIIKISKIDGEDYVEIVHDSLCSIVDTKKELHIAAEAKKREKEKLREQAKKNRRRMIIATAIALVIIGILLSFLLQNNKIIKEQEARNLSEAKKDSMQILTDSLQILTDSLQKRNSLISQQKESLRKDSDERSNHLLRIMNDSILLVSRNKELSDKNLELSAKIQELERKEVEIKEKNKTIEKFGELLRVANNTAGNLPNRIGELKTVTRCLSITGELNGTDVAFIRDMIINGILTELDIENSKIVSGGEPYYKSTYEKYNTENNAIGTYMFNKCSTLTSIKLPKTISNIKMSAFDGCDALKELTISSEEINSLSISYCKNLETLNLTDNVKVFDGFNLSGCKNLKNIVVDTLNQYLKDDNGVLYNKDGTQLIKYPEGKLGDSFFIPNTVSVIKRGAFMNSHLSVVTIPMSVKEIESSAFNDCKQLLELRMANSIENIGMSAFSGCETLESVNLPSSLSKIESLCFMGCRKLQEVNIGENVRKIDGSAFASCSSLQKLNISGKNRYYTVEKGIVYSSDKNVLVKCPAFLRQETIVIPSGVETIGEYAFDDCESISVVVLPETVSRINHSAFDDCSISSINIPSNMKSIDTFAFGRCKLLTNIISDVRDIEELKINSYTFKYISDNCMWVVPEGPRKDKNMYMELYKKQPWWKSSWTIKHK